MTDYPCSPFDRTAIEVGGIEEHRAIERGDGAIAGTDEPAPTPEDHRIADWLRIAVENRDLRPGKAL